LTAAQFTLELWFMREGAGKTASTSGSAPLVTGVPLITKGVAEVDGSNKDANYFFAIDGATGTLAADFEDMTTGGNHPVFGTTKIWPGVWYHAAATYNGRTWVLYLNGVPDVTLDLGSSIAPRSDSIQHAGLGAAFNSTGVATGAFQGQMDEVRIWNVARSQTEIQTSMGSQITTTTPGLLGRWGLDEGSGTAATSTVTTPSIVGTLTNGPTWVPFGAPYVATPSSGRYGMHFSGTMPGNEYVALGPAPQLGAQMFTIETWFRKEGAGQSTSTGTGALTAVPLVTKVRAESDNSNVDMNYFLGMSSTGVLAADFEDMPVVGPPAIAGGGNHVISGSTPIATGTWYHGAVTYDGSSLALYLNGNLEAVVPNINRVPRFDSIEHAALGSALTSTGAAAGFFQGTLDEARIWNYARSASQILAAKDREISKATGLLGRWSFNSWGGSTFTTADSSQAPAAGTPGTVIGPNWTTTGGAPMAAVPVNNPPTVDAGPDVAVTLPAAASLLGSFTDDNVAGPPAFAWSKVSGPGAVTFANASSPVTTATFSLPGSYVLKLTGDDSESPAVSDTTTVTVSALANLAPTVDAGIDQPITLPATTVTLSGQASDDGLPAGTLTTQWSKVSGPGPVTFGNAAALS